MSFRSRVSLGATRWRIVRQLLVESGAARAGSRRDGLRLRPRGRVAVCECRHGITFPYYIQWTIDGRVGVFIAAVCLGTAFLIGLFPAVQVSRVAANRSLKRRSEDATTGVGRRRLTTALLSVELALTLVLLAGAGLMMRSFLAVYRADSVVDATRVLTMPVALPNASTDTPATAHCGLPPTGGADRGDSRCLVRPRSPAVVPFAGGPSRQLSVDGRRRVPGESQPIVSYVSDPRPLL